MAASGKKKTVKKSTSSPAKSRKTAAEKPRGSKRTGGGAAAGTSGDGRSAGVPAAVQEKLRDHLVQLREQLRGQINQLHADSLRRDDAVNSVEDGTDAFDRQFALNLASNEENSLVQIDEALHRLDQGTYGMCEECAGTIEQPRLEALPFVRTCISCQSEIEKRSSGYRVSSARKSFI